MHPLRIFRISTLAPYQDYYNRLYDSLHLQEKSYDAALQEFLGRGLLHPASFSRCFKKLGYEVFEAVLDFPKMQNHWAKEAGFDQPLNWEQVLWEQLCQFRPHILFLERGGGFLKLTEAFKKEIKQKIPSLQMICGMFGTVEFHPSIFNEIDLVFCMDSVFVKNLSTHHIPTQLCYHAYDNLVESTLQPRPEEEFVFIGSSGFGGEDHRQRFEDLVWLIQNSPLKVWCHEYYMLLGWKFRLRSTLGRGLGKLPMGLLKSMESFATKTVGNDHQLVKLTRLAMRAHEGRYFGDWFYHQRPLQELFPDRTFPPLFGREYFELVKASKVVLNIHTDRRLHYGNMRTFEVCGLGGCLLTDKAAAMADLFEEGKEIVGYSSRDECLEKARYLLDHEEVRTTLKKNAKARVEKEHLFEHRAIEMDQAFQQFMKGKAHASL